MSLSPQWLDELRARTTLSTLIGKSVKVLKAGREYKACCPFHNEKTPSFTINDEKGFYHCFGCGAHGDAIRWMTDNRGLPFMEAVKELAAAAGMDVPAPDPHAAKRAEKAQTLHDVCHAAQDWFVAQLGGIDGAEARDYLRRRGMKAETVRAFGFGFAPDSRGRLKDALKAHGESRLIEAGLLIAPDSAGENRRDPYDRFRGRLMIPIRDARGRVIAFGGRILGSGEPKYLNSPDTPLFDKGRTLYNLDRASPASRQSGRVIVVEGYMDVIALSQAGFPEAVAPLGTALTEHQIERLWKMVEVPILCFDGDPAGQKAGVRAAMRALPLLRPGHSLAFATLPAGQDPDELVRAEGPRAFEAVLGAAQPLVDRLWEHEVAAGPLDTPEQRAGLKQRLREISNAIADEDVRALYAQVFRERYDALFFAPRAQAAPRQARQGGQGQWKKGQRGGWKPPEQPPSGEVRAIGSGGLEATLLRGIVTGLLCYPTEIRAHMEELSTLRIAEPDLARMMEIMLSAAMREEIVETEGLLTILGQGELYNIARGLLRADALNFTFTRKSADTGRARRDLGEAIRVMVAGPEIEAALAEATRRVKETLDEASYLHQQTLRAMKANHEQRLADLMQPEDSI